MMARGILRGKSTICKEMRCLILRLSKSTQTELEITIEEDCGV